MKHYLGIDIGTFESKASLVDASGNLIAFASHPHKMQVPQPGFAEHNAVEDWWGDFKRLSNRVIAESGVDPKSIKAVGASAIGPCMLPVDADGAPLMNGVLYGVDTRASKEIAYLNTLIGEKRILDTVGNALTSQAVGPKILWLKNNRPDLYARTHKFINSTTYVTWKLTGRYVIDHYSAGSYSPLYMMDSNSWSARLAPEICREDQLADLHWTTDVVGEVTVAAAAETGLAAGTPVICGTIDAAAEAVSVGVLSPGQMMVMYGSTIFIILVADKRVSEGKLWYSPWLFPGQHGNMAALTTCGTLTHWFRDQLARDVSGKQGTIALAQEAEASPPGANGVVMLPYFSGMVTPLSDPNARGLIFGLNLTHTRADIYRALLEGIALGTRHVIEAYEAAGIGPAHIEAVGGGTNNRVWSQSTSDALGRFQQVRSKTFGASYGDAFLAALGIGDVKRDDINQWNPPARVIAPNETHRDVYAKTYTTFRALYERNKDLM
ncbi:MAG: FGGY-family carbohydrate kinase [Aestuariivirga sp.]